jgi:lipid-binding SYLF domain-containing protein
MKTILSSFIALLVAFSFASVVALADDDVKKAAEPADEIEDLMEANTVIKEILAIPENGIPQEMLDNAAAVVVIPDLLKASLIAGVKSGEGVMALHGGSGWSHPAFVELAGGSLGLQAGVESTDLVLVFMSEKHVQKLLNGEFTLGADASVAAGPVGRQASAGTNENAKSAVYAYSRSKGLFAGISVDGSKISIDTEANTRVYGANANAHNVLHGQQATAPKEAEEFKTTLNTMTKANNPKAKS